jgi:hypothetical protein
MHTKVSRFLMWVADWRSSGSGIVVMGALYEGSLEGLTSTRGTCGWTC